MAQPQIPGTDIGKVVTLYGSDGSKWIALKVNATGRLEVIVNTAALPDDAATQTTLAALLVELALKADLTERQPVESKDGDKVLSFESVINNDDADTLSGGSNTALSSAVPSGRVWKIETIGVVNYSRAATFYYGGAYIGTTKFLTLSDTDGAAEDITSTFAIPLYLPAGGKIYFDVGGGQDNDYIVITYSGIQMHAP